jgi:hypothetical protein
MFSALMALLIAGKANSSCDAVLFAYFGGTSGETIKFALADDGRHFVKLNGGKSIVPLLPRNGSSVRDPFILRSLLDNNYHILATDKLGNREKGAGFALILMWSSPNLLDWSNESIPSVMSNYKEDLANLWAPEFVVDKRRQSHLIFWAADWKANRTHFDQQCNNNRTSRFSFWGCYTRVGRHSASLFSCMTLADTRLRTRQ